MKGWPRALWDGSDRRMLLFRWILCATLLSEMALCPRLWTGERAFPTVPAFAGLPDLPSPMSLGLVALLVGGILATALLPNPGRTALVAVASGAALTLFDLNRLQPWFYQALLLFLAVGLRRKRNEESALTWAASAFLLSATYVWSGLQKASPAFVVRVFPMLLHPLGLDALRPLGYAVPILETATGLLLLASRTRAWGLAGVVATHAFLLVALGPLGLNFNSVVWPWNVGMPLLVLVLLVRNPNPVLRRAWSSPVGKALVLVAGILPALNSVGLWDDSLSDALYSGRSRQAFVLFTERGAASLPPALRPYLQRRPDRIGLDLDRWALAALNVPPYPEPRVYRAVARRLRAAGVPSGEMALVVSDRPDFLGAKPPFRVVPID